VYKLTLAARYLIKRPITWIAVLAVAVCVFMVLVVLTIMTGLLQEFEQKNHRWVGDAVVTTDSLVGFPYYGQFIEKLEQTDYVYAASPVVRTYALLSYRGSDWNRPTELVGIDIETFARVTAFNEALYYNREDYKNAFKPPHNTDADGAVMGVGMVATSAPDGTYQRSQFPPVFAFDLTSFPLTARGALARAGLGIVSSQQFYFSDDVQSGLAEVDTSHIYIPFQRAQLLAGMDGPPERASAIHIKFAPGITTEQGTREIAALWADFVEENSDASQAFLLDQVRVESWRTFRRAVIAPIEHERTLMIAIFGLIAIITVFIILVIFYMIVAHKTKDIGILKSLGAVRWGILQLFLGFAFLTGVAGSIIGTSAGIGFLMRINQIEQWLYENYNFQLWDRRMYDITEIPSAVDTTTVVVIALAAIAICLIGAFIPSLKAANQQPVKTLQVAQV